MLKVTNISVALEAVQDCFNQLAEEAVRRHCALPQGALRSCQVLRRSIDCRQKRNVHFVITAAFELASAAKEAALLQQGIKNLEPYEPPAAHKPPQLAKPFQVRPIVVGTGPAGLFAALELARAGASPLVLERGYCVEQRRAAVDHFMATGQLNRRCNIQFGEGGAGTFSDGKLSTNTHNPLIREVLQTFVDAGAPHDILVDAKPHVGTDLLASIIVALRQQIIQLGGEVRFGTQLVDIKTEQGKIIGVVVETEDTQGTFQQQTIPAEVVVLATGHSARDTYRMLADKQVAMSPKAFSMGVRIEHLQASIDAARYGSFAGHPALGAADYHLSVKVAVDTCGHAAKSASASTKNNIHNTRNNASVTRGVYTFCMCPGGEVVAAASEDGALVTNGMSAHARNGVNANAALLATVTPEDYGATPGCDPLIGCAFQQHYEQAAFQLGGGGFKAPAQRVEDFLAGRPTTASQGMANKVQPTYGRGVVWTNLAQCLPPFVTDALAKALPQLNQKLKDFAHPDAVMTGVESRSSSPVRIERDAQYQASLSGLYPCGEGAGYAGGIVSAAVDGIRAADAVCLRYT